MYTLSHLAEPFLMPAGLVAAGLLLCILLSFARPRNRVAGVTTVLVFALYYLLSTWPVVGVMIRSLEDRVPTAGEPLSREGIEAIVILAGDSSSGPRGQAELNGAAWRRLWRGMEVYWKLDGKVPLVFSGGGPKGDPAASGTLALGYARRLGVPEGHFWLESGSRTTRESGLAVKKLLDLRFPQSRRHRIVLVTSAWHMPRSLMVFDRSAMEALPTPCDYMSPRPVLSLRSLVPTYEALSASSVALHEWIGILAYWLKASF